METKTLSFSHLSDNFRKGQDSFLERRWEELTNTVEKDYSDLHVAKFDCSVFRPMCQGIGVVDYPSLVWMKKGRIVELYRGQTDLESLKTYVFEKMRSDKFRYQVLTKKAIPTAAPKFIKKTVKPKSTNIAASGNSLVSKKAPAKTSTKKPAESSEKAESENASDDEDDDNEEEPENAVIDILNAHQESSGGSNSTEMEDIISLEDSDESAKITKKKILRVVKSSSNKARFLELSAANYTKSLNPNGVSLVMLYAPWCNFCDEIRKTLKLVALKHGKSSLITIGEIDCVNKDNKDLCLAEKLRGIPTINVYRKEKLLLNDYKGKTFEELNDCIESHLSDKGIKKWKQREMKRLNGTETSQKMNETKKSP